MIALSYWIKPSAGTWVPLKDAGIRTFMVNQIQDFKNQRALICQVEKTWSTADIVD
jgi:hypothetical protein